ncbi:hypothetical protein [Alkalihalobacillus pseudalcaliphilus]|uniref:tubby C-terminal domain-like protein n=1 Tax=Alkalihalobacillus pseudalcaliphilus TaxID=79884 RepID=UPI00064DE2A2|nr:hypothetical protein [Alkalihalobacillus pseudalcaliphilus]KMK75857.1 hypothetical protein AB990_11380 [Alkalihalobacillus pseudalcaliphilus]
MNSRMLAILLASIVFIIAEPIRASIQNEPLSDIYLTVVAILGVVVIGTGVRFYFKMRSRKQAIERAKGENQFEKLATETLDEGEYAYQEPFWMIHNHPVQIFNENKQAVASFQFRFKNSFEKWVSLLGFIDYRNVEVKDHITGDTIYFEHIPMRQSLWRDRWIVYKNNEEHAKFETAKISRKQLENQMLFLYQPQGGPQYEVISPRLSRETEIKEENDGPVILMANRTFLGIKGKGKEGNRGRKHELDDRMPGQLSFIEKVGMYQQAIVKVGNSR